MEDKRIDKNIIDLWNSSLIKLKQKRAVYYDNKFYTYNYIEEQSNQVAHYLYSMGIKKEEIVGVLFENSIHYIISIFAILKIGGAFMPLDVNSPISRLTYILNDSNVKFLISTKNIILDIKFEGRIIRLEEINMMESRTPKLDVKIDSGNLAYVLYTSGTTGEPKGVMVEHKNLVNLLDWYGKKYLNDIRKNVLQLANNTFDVSIEEIFGTLLFGGTLYIPPNNVKIHKVKFIEYINENQINLIQVVPVMLQELIVENENMKSIQTIICGGEPLSEKLKNKVLNKGYDLYNHYGPTETTIDVTSCQCFLDKEVSIGKAIDNVGFHILDKFNNPVNVGEIGELYLTGLGVARGYLNNIEMTNEKFIICKNNPKIKMYRTGDFVKLNENQDIIYIGREDSQIKINGNRIELKEVENCLEKHDQIEKVVVLVVSNHSSDQKIALFYKGSLTVDDVIEYLRKKIPDIFIPSYIKKIEEFSFTLNGKLDLKKLKSSLIEESFPEKILDTLSISEKNLKSLFKSWHKQIDIESNFYNIGIDSIDFVKSIINIEEEFKIEFEDSFLNYRKFKTVKELVSYIENRINLGNDDD